MHNNLIRKFETVNAMQRKAETETDRLTARHCGCGHWSIIMSLTFSKSKCVAFHDLEQ